MLKAITALCLLFAGASAHECEDSASWYKNGDTSKDCDWVSQYAEKRCTVKGWDKSLAEEACLDACGTCHPNPCADAPIRQALTNVECGVALAQSGADVTEGAVGMKDPSLEPIVDYNDMGMCTVNVHWHWGAEHKSTGQYDETYHIDSDHRLLAEEIREGYVCRIAQEAFEANSPLIANEYDWQYCNNMHVGYTYEFHWPHSSIGACQTEWQYQTPFMDGVLCGATMADMEPEAAVQAVFSGAVSIGVEGQIFVIVNSEDPTTSPYYYPTWDVMNGWNKDIVEDAAYYQGSTTGDGADNDMCRATGGMVTWHVDRECHFVEAATIDNLCRLMTVMSSDDMTGDLEPHGSRESVDPELADTPSDLPMSNSDD